MGVFARFSKPFAAAIVLLLLVGCTQSAGKNPAPSAAAAATTSAPSEPLTAKNALGPMYTTAYKWAPDVALLRMTALDVPGYKNPAGRAAAWEAVFASARLGQYRVITWSMADALPAIHKGIAADRAQTWNGPSHDAMPVDMSLFQVDSDTAYSAAETAAASWIKANPSRPLSSMEIGSSYRFPSPAWYVLWGDKKSGYAAFVDAESGKLLKPSK